MIAPLLCLVAAILPPSIDDWKRIAEDKAELPLLNVAREYGLLESDAATYENGAKKFKVAVHRVRDITGAMALEQSLQGPEKKIFRHQNFVFETLEGTAPRGAMDAFFFPTLKVDRSAPPMIVGYLPRKGRVQGSERLLLGPESLRAFEPRIPVAAAGFDFAAEVQIARYGNAVLAVFHYPNHAIARQQFAAIEKIPNSAISRSGPVVALVLPAEASQPVNPEAAQALAGQIQFKADIVMDKAPDKPEPNPGEFLIGVFSLSAILVGMCLVLGLVFALFRAYGRHWSGKKPDDEMTSLGI
ncbi:MAG: hypothetical protein FJW36_00085 [Acidobacteria bacterium]|nr:hypothetical protein [Acidobacteriota bacterium]